MPAAHRQGQWPREGQEIKARTQLAAIVRDYLKASAKAKKDQGRQMLEQLIKKFPDTEAAAAAKEMK